MLSRLKRNILENIANFLIRKGYYVAKPHFYNPIPDKSYILHHNGYWKYHYPCHGIEFHDSEQLSLCEQLSKFAQEINHLPEDILDPKKT